ncbi:MAG TPA: hypothetical protein VMB21_08220, partial [Candidatus Limnocylindria bacterium]|nr:hypothetical protein [Candidatus Limnocylindria bacterium]
MNISRFFSTFLLLCVAALAASAGPPTLTSPVNNAGDQPSDLTFTWEAGSLTNYVVNGSFEQASGGWATAGSWRQKPATESQPADAGTFFAGSVVDGRNSDTGIFQPIRLPRIGNGARLSWSDHTSGTLTSEGGELDSRIRWQVTTTLDGSTPVYDRTAGDNDGPGWQRHEV